MTDPRYAQPGAGGAASGGGEPSLGQLFSDLTSETQTLVKQELALAKTELTQSAKDIGMAVAKMIAAAFILYAGLIVLLFAIVALLHKIAFSWWVSALIVGGAVLLIGLLLVLRAKSQLSGANLKPTATISSLKDDAAFAKGQVQ
jgi:hypothetical protein